MMCERCGKELPSDTFFVVSRRSFELSAPAATSVAVRSREVADSRPEHAVPTSCESCTTIVHRRIAEQVDRERQDAARYANALAEVPPTPAPPPTPTAPGASVAVDEIESELAALEAQERQVREQWEAIQSASLSLCADESLFEEAEKIHWERLNAFSSVIASRMEEIDRLDAESRAISALVRTAKAFSVNKDAFAIGTSAGIGTINGCRLGKSGQTIPFEELNAAWGFVALLTYTLSHRLRATLSYRIVPLGGRSTVQTRASSSSSSKSALTSSIIESIVFPLFTQEEVKFSRAGFSLWPWGSGQVGTSGAPAAGPVGSRTFDDGMEAFLRCLHEIVSHCRTLDSTVKLPCVIDRDAIKWKDEPIVSIRALGNTEEKWNKALKFVLATLNRILAQLPSLVRAVNALSGSSPTIRIRSESILSSNRPSHALP